MSSSQIKLYLSQASACSYLADKQQTSVIVDPDIPLTTSLYSQLAEHGFRRSGDIAYRPQCELCQACVPIRIAVNNFSPSRSQKRNLKLNADIVIRKHLATFNEEHYKLYCDYQTARHPGSSMCDPSEEDYMRFLSSANVHTLFYEFRLDKKLVAIAVTDVLDYGLSAVYTFYDATLQHRGLGTYAILKQCEEAKNLDLPWLYLGFWIADSKKMAYKTNFIPCEGYRNNEWLPITPHKY